MGHGRPALEQDGCRSAGRQSAYYRYRDSNEARREYDGFPTLLVVTTSAAAEARFAYQAYLAQQRHGTAPLSIFLTTNSRVEACHSGVLGPIWRSAAAPWADEPARVYWLPRLRRQDGTNSGARHPIRQTALTSHSSTAR